MTKVYLDTNVLRSASQLITLSARARRAGYRVLVPALVHAERLAQMRREFGHRFDISAVNAFMDTNEIAVEPFDMVEAERASCALASAFPTDDRWHDAKKAAVQGRVPATTDFYIGAPLANTQHPLVSGDKGYEFFSLSVTRVTYDQAIAMFPEGEP